VLGAAPDAGFVELTEPFRTMTWCISVEMTTPNGAKRRFQHLLEMAQWAAANALKGVNNEWMNDGEAVF
jgi:hypothetical protein